MDTTDKIVKLDCFNPFNKPNHSHARKGLRHVSSWMCDLIPGTPELSKVCDSCRKQLTKLKNEKHREISTGTSNIHEESQSDTEIEEAPIDMPFSNESDALSSLNSSLIDMGESPVDKKRIQSKIYSTEKANRISVAVKRKLLVNACSDDENDDSQDEFFTHVKKVYNSFTSRKKKLQLLTLMPDSWSVRKVMQEFSAPNYLVRQAKTLLKKGRLVWS